jgi:predicted nucleotidyltransferase
MLAEMMKKPTPKLHPLLRRLTRELKKIYGPRLKKIVLFGSYARGEAAPDSDIDILVVLENLKSAYKESDRLSPLLADLSIKYNIVPFCLPIRSTEYEKADTPLLVNVHREGVVVYG